MNRRQFGAAIAGTLFTLGTACKSTSQSSSASEQTDVEADIAANVAQEVEYAGGQTMDCIDCGTQMAAKTTESSPAFGQEYRSQVPALSQELRDAFALKARYWRLPPAQRGSPVWLSDDKQPDYRHLAEFGTLNDPGFELNATTLEFLADRNSFVFSDKRPVRVFGLRGCSIEGDKLETDWATSHRLRVVKPDHIEKRCLIGLWHPTEKRLRLFAASTVPQTANMFAAIAADGWGTSLMPTGYYRYRAATHLGSSKPPRPQPGALKNDGSYVVLRTARELTYDVFGKLDYWTVGYFHNIHAAGRGLANPKFDSSGCQVITGYYSDDRRYAFGQWRSFQADAGLVGDDGIAKAEEPAGQGTFEYMLLTGLEAALYDHDSAFRNSYRRLRPGSQGDRVLALRTNLLNEYPVILGRNVPKPAAVFDWWTAFSVLNSHKYSLENEFTSTVALA